VSEAFVWLSDLIKWFGEFFPRWRIVNTTKGAVKWVWGKRVVKLGPGWHVYWPFSTQFQMYPTARQATDLRPQVVTTADNRTVLVGGLITYEIVDIEAILARTYDPEETIADIALTAFHSVCCRKTWAELRDGQTSGMLDKEIRFVARKFLGPYGVRVLKTSLTDLAPTQVMKLVTQGGGSPLITTPGDGETN
jgi:regulator of protease activity HflC (stomatin/prohibitin superfamily)